jgi:small GTP-binding protein
MGFFFSKVWSKLTEKRTVKMLMVGIDNAGKTTILYQLKMNEKVHSIPTIGFNVESVDYKGLVFSVWDVGGQDKIRVLWKHYFNGMDGIIFVVDCNDRDRVEESNEELSKLLKEEELNGLPLLVMANKQDLKDAVSPKELGEILNLSNEKNRKWLIQGTSASTGQGLKEGLDWLAETLLKIGKK